MKRRTSTAPVRVYRYSLPFGPDPEHRHLVEEQIGLARRYRNRLIAHERARRAAYREIMAEHGDVADLKRRIAVTTEEIDALQQQLRLRSKEERRRVKDSVVSQRIKALKAERKLLRAARREIEARVRNDPKIRAQLDALEARAKLWLKAERATCGVYWGTYLLVEEAMDAARKSHTDPEFRAARRYPRMGIDGSIGVQLQKGAPATELLRKDANTKFQIFPLPQDAFRGTRAERLRKGRTRMRIRVGSNPDRSPIWAEFKMLMHRPMPPDAIVKSVRVKRRRIGTRFRWECLLTLEAESLRTEKRAPSVTAAVDFGWRKVEGGLRVARIVDELGGVEDVILPWRVVGRFEKSDSLQSIRSRNFNEVRDELVEWLKTHEAPEWLRARTATLSQWRSENRLTAVGLDWRDERFAGDEEIFARVDAWRRQERHLFEWEANNRSKAEGLRKDVYRCAAKRIARKYPRLVLPALDLAQAARRPKAGEDDNAPAAHIYRRQAAVGELRLALQHAVACDGGQIEVVEVLAGTCHLCGAVCDIKEESHHQCERCRAVWDVDTNRCAVLLAEGAKSAA